MKCWRCGQEIADGTQVCLYCGADLKRSEPATEEGKAMRSIYDRYGAEKVLMQPAYLVNGLNDLLPDENKKLRNGLRAAFDSKVGELYLDQLTGQEPKADFDKKILTILTEDAGLAANFSKELMKYFDEMIGWVKAEPEVKTVDKKDPNQKKDPEKKKDPDKKEPKKKEPVKDDPLSKKKEHKTDYPENTADAEIPKEQKTAAYVIMLGWGLIVLDCIITAFFANGTFGLIDGQHFGAIFGTAGMIMVLAGRLFLPRPKFYRQENFLRLTWKQAKFVDEPIWYVKIHGQWVYVGTETEFIYTGSGADAGQKIPVSIYYRMRGHGRLFLVSGPDAQIKVRKK